MEEIPESSEMDEEARIRHQLIPSIGSYFADSKYVRSRSRLKKEAYTKDGIRINDATADSIIELERLYCDALEKKIGPSSRVVKNLILALRWQPASKKAEHRVGASYLNEWAVHGLWQELTSTEVSKQKKKTRTSGGLSEGVGMPSNQAGPGVRGFIKKYSDLYATTIWSREAGSRFLHEWDVHGRYIKVDMMDYLNLMTELGSKLIPLVRDGLNDNGILPGNTYEAKHFVQAMKKVLGGQNIRLVVIDDYLFEMHIAVELDLKIGSFDEDKTFIKYQSVDKKKKKEVMNGEMLVEFLNV